MKTRILLLSLFVLLSGAVAAQESANNASAMHIDQYIEKMRVEMDAIEREGEVKRRHQLMKEHMESMVYALVTMQAEIQPATNRAVGLHAEPNLYADEDIDASVDSLEEAIRLRQMQAILEQMSRHRKALENDTPR